MKIGTLLGVGMDHVMMFAAGTTTSTSVAATTASTTLTQPSYPTLGTAVQSGFGIFSRVGAYAIQVIVAAIGLGILVIGAMYLWKLIKKWLAVAK